MSYYRSQMGDYKTYGYAGDPGWLSSIWKGVKKFAGPILGGVIGGPVGAVIGAAGAGAPQKPRPPMLPPPGTIGGAVSFPGGTQLQFARAPGVALGPQAAGAMAGVCPTGYHLAKDGSGRMVRNRRMNIANPRALRRAMRRVQGFEKMAKRTISFTKRVRMK